MDFIMDLPTSPEGDNAIFVIVDRLTKLAHFVPTRTTVTATGAADLLLREWIRLHGVPRQIISDRDPRFTATVWRTLMKKLQVNLGMSTAGHPQTDGQTERLNRTLEQMLRQYVRPDQTDWKEFLPHVEFAYNSAVHEATRISPFMAAYGCQPCDPLDRVLSVADPTPLDERLRFAHEARARVRTQLEEARKRYETLANKGRRDLQFEVGQEVKINRRMIVSLPGGDKLGPLFDGPHKVKRRIGAVAYELDLPTHVKLHPVFHVSMLEPFHRATAFPAAHREVNPGPVDVNGEPEWIVHGIRGKRKLRGETRWLIRWKGYSPLSDTWEPARCLAGNESFMQFEGRQARRLRMHVHVAGWVRRGRRTLGGGVVKRASLSRRLLRFI